jgi:hypothetical protein
MTLEEVAINWTKGIASEILEFLIQLSQIKEVEEDINDEID